MNNAVDVYPLQDPGAVVDAAAGEIELFGDINTGKMASVDENGNVTTYGLGSVAQFQIFYFGKHGNDSNTGKSVQLAKLTIQACLTAADALTPSSTNRFVIRGEDAGIYTENLTINQWTGVEAPAAIVSGNIVVKGNAGLDIQRIDTTSGIAILKDGDTMHSIVRVGRIACTGTAKAIDVALGTVMMNVEMITHEAGNAINVTDATTGSELRGFVNHISGFGAGAALAIEGDADNKISLVIVDIRDDGTGTGVNIDAGELSLFVTNFISTTGGDIDTGAEMNLLVAELNGTVFTGAGTKNITEAGVSGGIPDVEADPSPTLGGDLNTGGFQIVGDNGPLIDFVDVVSAQNSIQIENGDGGVSPKITVIGPNTNIGFQLDAKGFFGLVKVLTTLEVTGGVQAESIETYSKFNTMTTTQRDALTSPETGSVIYNTTDKQYQQYDGVSWLPMTTGGAVNPEVGTTYTVVNSDNGRIVTLDNASPIVVSINTGLADKFHCQFINIGAGEVSFAGTATLKNRQGHTKLAGTDSAASIQNYGVTDTYNFQGDTA